MHGLRSALHRPESMKLSPDPSSCMILWTLKSLTGISSAAEQGSSFGVEYPRITLKSKSILILSCKYLHASKILSLLGPPLMLKRTVWLSRAWLLSLMVLIQVPPFSKNYPAYTRPGFQFLSIVGLTSILKHIIHDMSSAQEKKTLSEGLNVF